MLSAETETYKGEVSEQAVLGSILKDGACAHKLLSLVEETDFFSEYHRIMYKSIAELVADKSKVDVTTVSNRIHEKGFEPDLGYIVEMVKTQPSSANLESYAKGVKSASLERKLVLAAKQIIGYQDQDLPIDDKINNAQALMMGIQSNTQADVYTIKDVAPKLIEDLQQRFEGRKRGLTTGFKDLDKRMNGYQPGNLIIVAGRPGMGKTTFAMNIAENNLDKNTLFFSMEMTKEELLERSVCSIGTIPGDELKTGKAVANDNASKISPAFKKLIDSNISIVNKGGLSFAELSSIARKENGLKKLDLVIVDYIQLMRGKKSDVREQVIADISRSLKGLAMELQIPVVALSQLSRKCEERNNKRPIPSDLRESGSIEQDADVIHFCYRDVVYDENTDYPDIAEIITAKFRSGCIGTDYLSSQLNYYRFKDVVHKPVIKEKHEERFNI